MLGGQPGWARAGAGMGVRGRQAPANRGCGPETLRVADQGIKDADNLGKARPLSPVLVPTVKHELVQGPGAAHGCWQAVPLLHGADDLGRRGTGWARGCPALEAPPPLPTQGPTLTSRLVMFQ